MLMGFPWELGIVQDGLKAACLGILRPKMSLFRPSRFPDLRLGRQHFEVVIAL